MPDIESKYSLELVGTSTGDEWRITDREGTIYALAFSRPVADMILKTPVANMILKAFQIAEAAKFIKCC